jgi:DNA replication protein DnaC
MIDTPQVLLAHHLKALKLPTILREYDKIARQCAAESLDYPRYLLRLVEAEIIERERRMVDRRIKAAKFPTVKSLDSFDFAAFPDLNKALVMELARSEYVERRENVIAVGNSGTGKSHIGLGLGLAACQKGLSVGFANAAALVHELIEARDEKRLLRLQRQLAAYKLLIIDELGFVPLSQTGAELLFEVFSQRYERGSTLVTTNLPFDEWTSVFGSERLTGAPARPPDTPRPYPGDERRELPPRPLQASGAALQVRYPARRRLPKVTAKRMKAPARRGLHAFQTDAISLRPADAKITPALTMFERRAFRHVTSDCQARAIPCPANNLSGETYSRSGSPRSRIAPAPSSAPA